MSILMNNEENRWLCTCGIWNSSDECECGKKEKENEETVEISLSSTSKKR